MPTAATLREIQRATRHHGVTPGRSLDLTPRQIERCVADGLLVRRHRDVFVDPTRPPSPLQDLAAGVAAGGPVSGAWARSSGRLWGIWGAHPPRPEVVVRYGRLRLIEGVTVRRSRVLEPSMLTHRDNIRTTKPLITILDLGVVVSPVEVGDAIIRGLQLKLFTLAGVHETINRYARPGRSGTTAARQAAALILIDGRPAESVLEFRFHTGPREYGLPPYVYQHEVRVGHRRYRVDFAYPEVKLAIEVDGVEFHSDPAQVEYDEHRDIDLSLAGWTVMRFRWSRVTGDPAGVAADVLMKLGQLGYQSR